MSADLLRFDILLSDEDGHVCEKVEGVHMRDVSGGRLQPPVWIRPANKPDPLENLRKACLALAIVELDGLAGFAPQTLTAMEAQRYQKMGARRRKSYLGARLALKRLYRICRGADWTTPASHIETFCMNSALPCMGRNNANRNYHCSVSHDRRFAIAVADTQTLGVDVEVISTKALESAGIFMSLREREMIRQAPLNEIAAAVRIWSVKEAAAKATGMNLAESWVRVQVKTVGEEQSCLSIDGSRLTAQHGTVDDHLFTLVTAGANAINYVSGNMP
jgi:phosphopantetheinyl transferase